MNNLKIGVDFYFATQVKRRGIGNYTYYLYRSLCESKMASIIIFIPKSADLLEVDFPGAEIVRLPSDNYIINENIFVPLFAFYKKIDFLHFTGNSVPPLSVFINKNVCVTVHDTMFMDFRLKSLAGLPQLLSRFYRMVTLRIFGDRIKCIFTVSEYSATKIINEFPRIVSSDIHVTYQGVGNDFLLRKSFELIYPSFESERCSDLGKYFFAIGAKEPRKNLKGLLSSYALFLTKSKLSNNQIKLVVAGLDEESLNSYSDICVKMGIGDYVVLMGYLSNDHLFNIYKNAVAFIFISKEEGFGIPLLEAFAAKCPVICSNTTSLPEIAGNAAILVNPSSPREVAQAMLNIINEVNRNSLIEKGSHRLSEFAWPKISSKFLEIIRYYC